MTGTDVITNRARVILTDSGKLRWSDPLLISFLNDGVQLIADTHHDALLTDVYTLSTLAPLNDDPGATDPLDDTISISDRYRDALVDYVCTRAFSVDSQNKQDMTRASHHSQQFAFKAGIPMPRVLTPERRG